MKRTVNLSLNEPDDEEYLQEFDDAGSKNAKRFKKRRRHKIVFRLIVISLVALLANFCLLAYTGKIWVNTPRKKDYPVRGMNLDYTQGSVDLTSLQNENITFVYIKATEGMSLQDNCFDSTWATRKDSKLYIGAYHTFSFGDSGEKQAENFIKTAGSLKSMKGSPAPAVEIGLDGFSTLLQPEKDDVVKNLNEFCGAIKKEYGRYPIIMCGGRFYDKYLKDDFSGFDFWIKSLFSKPSSDTWRIWQYNPRGKSSYVSDGKKYLNLSIFNGSLEEFEDLLLK